MFTMTSVRWQKSYPYRNEMMRLLLHSFYAIKVSFFIPKQKILGILSIYQKLKRVIGQRKKGEQIC